MQKIILDTIEKQREIFFQANTFDELAERCEKFLKQALTNAFKAGQKSREKEIKKNFINQFCNDHNGKIRWLRGVAFDMDDLLDQILASLSLTKESK
jgi:hypothetical protein